MASERKFVSRCILKAVPGKHKGALVLSVGSADHESGTLLVHDQDYWNTDDWKLKNLQMRIAAQ